jgi:hypothetical protein
VAGAASTVDAGASDREDGTVTPVWIALIAAISGSTAGAVCGFISGSIRVKRALPVPVSPPAVVGPAPRQSRKDAAARRGDLERTAALVGLDILRDLEAATDTILRTHKHFPDADGKCPLGLTDEIPAWIIERGQDLGRYLTAYAQVISVDVDGLLTGVGLALPALLSPPTGPRPVRVKGPRRETCPHFDAAAEAITACQHAQAALRDLLYGGPATRRAITAAQP